MRLFVLTMFVFLGIMILHGVSCFVHPSFSSNRDSLSLFPILFLSNNDPSNQESSVSTSSAWNSEWPLWAIVLVVSVLVVVVLAVVVWFWFRNRGNESRVNIRNDVNLDIRGDVNLGNNMDKRNGVNNGESVEICEVVGNAAKNRISLEQISVLSLQCESPEPALLSKYWYKHHDAAGNAFYFNSLTKTSHWTLPKEPTQSNLSNAE